MRDDDPQHREDPREVGYPLAAEQPIDGSASGVAVEHDLWLHYQAATVDEPWPAAGGQYPPDDVGASGLSVAKALTADGRMSEYTFPFGDASALEAEREESTPPAATPGWSAQGQTAELRTVLADDHQRWAHSTAPNMITVGWATAELRRHLARYPDVPPEVAAFGLLTRVEDCPNSTPSNTPSGRSSTPETVPDAAGCSPRAAAR